MDRRARHVGPGHCALVRIRPCRPREIWGDMLELSNTSEGSGYAAERVARFAVRVESSTQRVQTLEFT